MDNDEQFNGFRKLSRIDKVSFIIAIIGYCIMRILNISYTEIKKFFFDKKEGEK